MHKDKMDYQNLEGLLILCMCAKLVTLDENKRHWLVTQKFADLINEEIFKGLPPESESVGIEDLGS